MNKIQKIAFGIIVASFLLNGVLWVNGYGINRKIKKNELEIKKIKDELYSIETTFPQLKIHSEKVLDLFSENTIIPEQVEKEWYTNFFDNLHVTPGVKLKYTIKKRKIPFGMETPWDVRQLGMQVYLTIIPSVAKVELTGNLPQITSVLKNLKWHNPYIRIGKIELRRDEKTDLYNGVIELIMPQLYYKKDLQKVQEFVEKMSSKKKSAL